MSSAGLEQELKLVAPSATVLDNVLRSDLVTALLDPASDQESGPRRFRGVYYDTADGTLERQRCSLRARQEGDRLVAAFKLAGVIENGLSSRMEYEAPLTSLPRTVSDLPESILKQHVITYISSDVSLEERVVVDMQRTIRDLLIQGPGSCKIELVADSGTIHGGGLAETLFEIELELKGGSIEPMLALGERLAASFDLEPSVRTKHQIGMNLRARSDAVR